MPTVERINALEETVAALSDDEIRAKATVWRERIQSGVSLESLLPEVFAVVREVSRRTLGMRQFDVQLVGGVVLHQGRIAEMKTGEGKTLVAVAPMVLNAL
ncbi:MAG: preprotein translocase subunit SecA, partial [Chthonomonas sp.]|nr:preprotein translocase subunit SecA [Chthonomonas sp.]